MKNALRKAGLYAIAAISLALLAPAIANAVGISAYRALTALDRALGFKPDANCVENATGKPVICDWGPNPGAEAVFGFLAGVGVGVSLLLVAAFLGGRVIHFVEAEREARRSQSTKQDDAK